MRGSPTASTGGVPSWSNTSRLAGSAARPAAAFTIIRVTSPFPLAEFGPRTGLPALGLPQAQHRAGRVDDDRERAGVRHLGYIPQDRRAERLRLGRCRRDIVDIRNEQRAFQHAARESAGDEWLPYAPGWEEREESREEALRKAAALGFAGIYVGDKFGGSGLSRLDATIIFEELATACVSTAAYLSIHNMAAWMIDRFGSEAQRARFLPKLMSMEHFASYCLTEPGSGSGAAALATRARRDGEEYVLNGAEAFISGGGRSDLYVTMVRTGEPGPKGISCLVVENGTNGLSFGKKEKKLGWNTQPTAMVNFEDCRVPVANRLGAEGEGFAIAMMGLDGGRLNIGACSLGGARACWEAARGYMLERRQFGQRLADFQALQFKLADMATELDAARLMLRRAAASPDKGDPDPTLHCAMAKRLATDPGFPVR